MARAHRQLVTGRRGYYLFTHEDHLDVTEFDRWAQQAREALRAGDDAEAARACRRALAVWRGNALSDVPAGPHLRTQIDALEQARVTVIEQCFEAELRLGYHREILAELCLTAARHPLNERFQAQHMLALYRSGRQVEAFNVFHRLRRTLAEDLGLDPSHPVQLLHQAMLSADHSLNPN